MSATVSADIGTLTTEVAALHSAVTAAATGFQTLKDQIAALQASGGLSAADAAALHAAVTEIATDTASLAQATPATPTPPAP